MNDRYFACPRCKVYVEAGYRWAYWQLEEPEIVTLGQIVDVGRVIAASAYWTIDADHDPSLHALLPQVRSFLDAHDAHGILYAEDEQFLDADDPPRYFEWLQVAGLAVEPSPRYFAETLNLRSWADVESWVTAHDQPWWWQLPEVAVAARRAFSSSIT